MFGKEFVFPDDEDLVDVLGVASEPLDGEDAVRTIQIHSSDGDWVRLVCDIPGRSVRLQWNRGESTILDLFREEAIRLSLCWVPGKGEIVVTFEAQGLAGDIRIQVSPSIGVVDSMVAR